MKAGLGGGSGACGGGGGGGGGWGGAIADFVDKIEADFIDVVVACFVVLRVLFMGFPIARHRCVH